MDIPAQLAPDESKGVIAIALTASVVGLAFVIVVLRLYTRIFIVKNVGWDDYLTVFSLCMAFACGFCMMFNVQYGHGRHIYYLTPDQIQNYVRLLYFVFIFYGAGLSAVKAAFLVQYWRVLGVGRHRRLLIVGSVVVGVWCTVTLLLEVFSCSPIKKLWIPAVPGHCIPRYPRWYFGAGGNIVTDIIVFTLPLPIISRLNLTKGHKIALLCIFSLGFFTVSISAIRVPYLVHFEHNTDITWLNVELAAWSISEICSGIFCSCLLTFRPLIKRWAPRLAAPLTHKSTDQPHDANGELMLSVSNKPWAVERSLPARPVRTPESTDSLYNPLFEDVHREMKLSSDLDPEHGEIAIGYAPGQSFLYRGDAIDKVTIEVVVTDTVAQTKVRWQAARDGDA